MPHLGARDSARYGVVYRESIMDLFSASRRLPAEHRLRGMMILRETLTDFCGCGHGPITTAYRAHAAHIEYSCIRSDIP